MVLLSIPSTGKTGPHDTLNPLSASCFVSILLIYILPIVRTFNLTLPSLVPLLRSGQSKTLATSHTRLNLAHCFPSEVASYIPTPQ